MYSYFFCSFKCSVLFRIPMSEVFLVEPITSLHGYIFQGPFWVSSYVKRMNKVVPIYALKRAGDWSCGYRGRCIWQITCVAKATLLLPFKSCSSSSVFSLWCEKIGTVWDVSHVMWCESCKCRFVFSVKSNDQFISPWPSIRGGWENAGRENLK